MDWEHSGLYLRNKIFPKYRICAGTQQIIKIFIIEQIQTNFFFKLKNSYFLPISPIKVFPKNRAVMHNFIRVSSTMAKFREISWSNSKKTLWQMSGGKDRQTLFHRILPATSRGLKSTTAVDWDVKVKDRKCDVCLIKNYCITVACKKPAQSINSFTDFRVFHQFFLEIQPILESQDQTGHTHFWP